MKCELCSKSHDGAYGSGRFCGSICARSFSTKTKRTEINQKVSAKLKGCVSPLKDKPGRKLTQEDKDKISRSLQERHRESELNLSEEERCLKKKRKNSRIAANVAAYRCRQKDAVQTDTDLDLIKKIYENCPPGYHVDHIHALALGGPHHQDNLQYLPGRENSRKGAGRTYDENLAIDWRSVVII